jgi:hypothetical protein
VLNLVPTELISARLDSAPGDAPNRLRREKSANDKKYEDENLPTNRSSAWPERQIDPRGKDKELRHRHHLSTARPAGEREEIGEWRFR